MNQAEQMMHQLDKPGVREGLRRDWEAFKVLNKKVPKPDTRPMYLRSK